MIIKELKFALRKLLKESNFTLMNLTGLTLGVSFSFLIFLYVADQFSYDQHIPDADNIYRVSSDFTINGHQDIYANAPRPMGYTLAEEFPEIITATKIVGFFGLQVHAGYLKTENEQYLYSSNLFAADSNFLKVFDLPLVAGDKRALRNPNSAIISQAYAKKLFGNQDPMGQFLTLENEDVVQVTGVLQDSDAPGYMTWDVVFSYSTFYPKSDSEIWWYGGHVITYIKTVDGFTPQSIYDQWEPFYTKHMKTTFDEMNGTAKIILQPVTELYLWEEYIWEPYPHNSRQNLYIFLTIGFFLIVVAGFNYMNLSISQAFYRHKSIAVQRIIGAGRWSIIRQHLMSSVIISTFAALLSISLLSTLVPVLNRMINQTIELNFLQEPSLLLKIIGMSLLCGLLASVYPALRESRYQPKDLRKNTGEGNGLLLRKLFVVGQQAIAVGLIIVTLVVIDQINYVKNRDVGFDKENLLIMNLKDMQIRKNLDALNAELERIPGVVNITRTDESTQTGINEFTYLMQNKEGEFVSTPSQTLASGLNFLNTMQIELLAGRELEERDDDYRGLLISSFLADKMGYTPEEALGVKIKFGEDDEHERRVVGVIDDFNMMSAQAGMEAMTVGMNKHYARFLIARLDPKNQQETIMQIRNTWNNYSSGIPFSYSFVEDDLNGLLAKEDTLYDLLLTGSFLIIIISGLGLFGLASHAAIQRTKEIGIRKVVGAGKHQLFYTMIREFLVTLGIAFVVGTCISWYLGTSWLDGFMYRVHFNWLNTVIAAMLSVLIVVLTLSYHTFKVINGNPVDSLRDE